MLARQLEYFRAGGADSHLMLSRTRQSSHVALATRCHKFRCRAATPRTHSQAPRARVSERLEASTSSVSNDVVATSPPSSTHSPSRTQQVTEESKLKSESAPVQPGSPSDKSTRGARGHRRRTLKTPPGPPPLPFLGNLLQVGLGKATGWGPQPHVAMKALAEKYGDVMRVQMGSGAPWVVLSSPAAVHEAFVVRGGDFSGRPMVPSMGISSGGGKGFAGSRLTPELRELRRAAFADLFGPAQLAASHRLLASEAEALAAHLAGPPPLDGGSAWGGKREVEIRPSLRHAVTNMVLLYVFGTRVPYSTEPSTGASECPLSAELAEVVGSIWTILTDTGTTLYDMLAPSSSEELTSIVYQPLRALVRRRDSILRQMINQRRARHSTASQRSSAGAASPGGGGGPSGAASPGGGGGPSGAASPGGARMADVLLAGGFADEEVLYVLVDMFVAGVNTVASTGEWLVLLSAAHPEVQRRARRELRSAPHLAAGCSVRDAPFVGAVVKEVLRAKQPLLLPRQAVRATSVGGFRVPEGAVVYANNHALTHGPRWWRRPEEFRPARFLEEERTLHSAAAGPAAGRGDRTGAQSSSGAATSSGTTPATQLCKFIPFSIGHRVCPGARLAELELEILAVHLFKHLSWEPALQEGLAGALGAVQQVDLREEYSLTLMPAVSQKLRFTRV